MRAKLLLTGIAGILMLGAIPLIAHHAFGGEFDPNRPVLLKGTVTKVEWVNPHGWIYIDVKQPNGKVANWAVEAGSPQVLARRGLKKNFLPIGAEVVITGYQARDGPTPPPAPR